MLLNRIDLQRLTAQADSCKGVDAMTETAYLTPGYALILIIDQPHAYAVTADQMQLQLIPPSHQTSASRLIRSPNHKNHLFCFETN
jgi:hypothetical protein